MSKKLKERLSPQGLEPTALLVVRVLLTAALLLACYLLWVSVSGGGVAGCGPESSCDRVLHSRWSRWLGLPVSALALPLYLAMLAGTWRLGPATLPAAQRTAWCWLIPSALAVAGAALWFVAVQAFVIRSFCPFCMSAHGCGFVASLLLLRSAPILNPPEQREKLVFVPPGVARKLALIALSGVGVLVAGQYFQPARQQYQEGTFAGNILQTTFTNSGIVLGAAPSLPADGVGARRLLSVFDGAIQLDLQEVPILGAAEATNTMVSLFDYTCHHCRIMHGHLVQATRVFSNRLAIVSLPMPLSEHCNHTVKRTPRVHEQSCEYARLGLAVWRANRKAHARFEDWLFAPATPPPLEQAELFASQLAGPVAFEAAIKDPWIDQQIQRDVSLYETNYLRGVTALPQLIMGARVTSGIFNSPEELYQVLSTNLNLKIGG